MIPAASYDYVYALLNDTSLEINGGFAEPIPQESDFVGFLLFDQNFSRPPSRDFLSNLSLLNENSGRHIHFFLPGVSKYAPNRDDFAKEIPGLDTPHYHNARAFLSFKDAFEKEIEGWQYDGGVSLILIDVVSKNGIKELNFDSAIYFYVEELIGLKIISATSELLHKIIRLKRDGDVKSAAEIKAVFEKQFGQSWIKALLFSLFPKQVKSIAKGMAVLGGGKALKF